VRLNPALDQTTTEDCLYRSTGVTQFSGGFGDNAHHESQVYVTLHDTCFEVYGPRLRWIVDITVKRSRSDLFKKQYRKLPVTTFSHDGVGYVGVIFSLCVCVCVCVSSSASI